jgi:predicted RND superfamily exporter protein
MEQRLEGIVLRYRAAILAGVAVVSVLAAIAYWDLRVENKIDSWFPESDPDYVQYREFRDLFQSEETLFVVLHAPDVFTRDVLGRIDRLTRSIETLPQVTRTLSLTNIENITGSTEAIFVDPLVPALDLDDRALAELRRRVLSDPFYPGMIVSSDGRTTVIVADIGEATAENNVAVVDAIDAAIARVAAPALEMHVAGWAAVNVVLDRLTQRDVRHGLPFTLAVLALCLGLAFRSLRVVLIINVAVLLATYWTMGAFAALGFRGTFLTVSALPGILLALALATGVHVVARFREEHARTPDLPLAVRHALRAIAAPVALTCTTTAIGFGSLVVADLAPVRHLGLFAALGMAFTCLISLTVVPIALVALPPRHLAAPNPWLERMLGKVADFDTRHHRAILAVSLVLALVSLAGMAQLRPQGSSLDYLPADSAPVEAMHFIEDHFGGASTFDVLVSGPPDVLKDPVAAQTVAAVQELLASYPETTASFAYTDLLRRMNQALHDGDPGSYRLPDTMRGIAQQLLLYETSGGTELPTLVDVSSYGTARVTARTTSFLALEESERLHDRIAERLTTLAPGSGPRLRLEISGDWALWLRLFLSLLGTMAKSLALAFAGVALMMILLMRSVWLGLIAMIPNTLPVLVAVGAMGWIGIQLDFATVMVAGIALGIAVDDTIHYLFRFRRELASGAGPTLAMRRTLTTVGKAMVTTSVVLFLGFGSMVTSSLPPHRTFAVIIALTMVIALASDLFLLPALLKLVRVAPPAQPEQGGGGILQGGMSP